VSAIKHRRLPSIDKLVSRVMAIPAMREYEIMEDNAVFCACISDKGEIGAGE